MFFKLYLFLLDKKLKLDFEIAVDPKISPSRLVFKKVLETPDP